MGYPKILYKMRRENVGTNLSNLKSVKMKKKVIFFTLAFTLLAFKFIKGKNLNQKENVLSLAI